MKALGVSFQFASHSYMARSSSSTEWKAPRRIILSVISPNHRSHLIEPGTAGRCEMEVEAAAFSRLEPTLNSLALVGAVVVENKVNVQLRGNLFFQLIQEFDEFLSAMAWQTTADDFAIEDIEGSKLPSEAGR
jgi:hypothetical protein